MSAQQVIVLTEATWTGLGSTDNWSLTANWIGNRVPNSNNSLIFGGSTRLTPTNDISSFSVNNITFPAAAGAFSISGIAFTKLDNSYITNNSSNAQSISNDIALSPGTAGGIINSNTAAITLSGVISGANRLIKNGANTLVLTGINTYTGTTEINAGKLQYVRTNTTNDYASIEQYTIASGAILEINTSAVQGRFAASNNSITGAGTFIKSGVGRASLTAGTSTMPFDMSAGASVDIQAGILDGSAKSTNLASLTLAADTQFAINGTDSNLTLQFDVVNGTGGSIYIESGDARTLQIGANGGSGTYSGVITGLITVVKIGSGAQTFAGDNTYTGSTSITAGTLVSVKGTATASFTPLSLIADFSSVPSVGQTYRFFPGSTVQRYYSTRSNGVIFTDSGDTVTATSHGLSNGTAIYFSSITSTTGISTNTRYYVISSTTNTFQLAASVVGAALPLATNGSGVMSLSTSIGSATFVDSTNRVALNSHGLTNGSAVYFSSITSTSGISINTVYYVINATADDFQLATLSGGSVVDLVTNGTGILCKNPMVSLTGAGSNIGSYSSNNSTLSVIGQLGATITGPQYAQCGRSVDINSAGDAIVVGGSGFGAGGGSYSKVFVYTWSGSAWIQRGSTFTGSAGEFLGTDVSLNADGTVVAMSTGTGDTVKVYAWNGTAWIQRGSTFTAASGETSLGSSISLNAAGDRIAIGAFTAQSGTGQPVGLVKIFSWSGSAWTQLGTTFAGVNTGSTGNYYVGTKVVLNDAGDRVLITSGGQSGGSTPDRGMGRVYSYSASTWTQVGNDILGTVNGEQIGKSASMNAAGDVVALGTTTTNKAKVYSLVSSTWTQLGSDIVEANNNYFATSISLNAVGNRIAIGETLFPSPAIGRVRIYDYNNSVWSQFGSDANGTASYDYYGQAVALNSAGDKVLIGAPGLTSLQTYGYVRAFQI